MDTPGQFPIIDGVAIPMDFGRFVPPDLEHAVHFYPRYLGFGGKLAIQFYLCEIVRQLACYESAHGRAEAWGGHEAVKDEALKHFFSYLGTNNVIDMIKAAQAEYERCAEERGTA